MLILLCFCLFEAVTNEANADTRQSAQSTDKTTFGTPLGTHSQAPSDASTSRTTQIRQELIELIEISEATVQTILRNTIINNSTITINHQGKN